MQHKRKRKHSYLAGLIPAALLFASPHAATASVITDPTGDFLPSYSGPLAGDLDVTGLKVSLGGGNFSVHTDLAGNVGLTPGGFYVYGINRGAGTAGFAANDPGLNRVLFDAVLIVRQNRSGTLNIFGGPGPVVIPNFATFTGNMIDFTIASALIPSTGFAADRYGWNLWPRSGAPGFAGISDFAPSNGTVAAVPEPAGWALMLSGLALAGAALRRRTARPVHALA